jgi:hypothetical protein
MASDDELSWIELRTRLTLSWQKWEFRTEFNFADLQEPGGNWLRELNFSYNLSEDWQLRVGRIFLPAGFGTPARFELETVNYPFSDPFNCYATGVMLEGELKGDWSLMLAVTGASGLSFDDKACWENPEFSARLEKKLQSGSVAGTLQISSAAFKVAADFAWQPAKDFSLRGEVSYVDNASQEVSNCVGAYLLAAYKPLTWLELHGQLDGTADIQKSYQQWQQSKADDGSISVERVEVFTSDAVNVVWTAGLRLLAKDDQFSFTVDYEKTVEGDQPDRLLARAQLRF